MDEKYKLKKRITGITINPHHAQPAVRRAAWPSLLWKLETFLVIIWMIIIFAFSAQPAQQSSKTSHSVSYKIAEWQNRLLRQEKTEQALSKQAESMQLIIRKSAHMGN